MANCNYCGQKIPEDRYMLLRFQIGIDKGYCDHYCKGRAGTLRAGVHNSKKMPKTLSNVDEAYIKKYLLELNPPCDMSN